ncbi:MAG: response regulator transcription factor, partial [Chloroflexi bacterium]|nr:response regulator transcription factor [Chloroflexota bacterium]
MGKQQTILVVDDETTVREVVRKYLEREGFRVIEAETGPLALHLIHQEQPDLVVLDIMLPGLDGFTMTRSLRDPAGSAFVNEHGSIPIIMLTARTEEADRITGFELGTDDYVTKPFSPRELVMRIKAVLRRTLTAADEEVKPLVLADLWLEPNSRTAKRGEVTLALTAKEFDLLWFLACHPRQVFTRTQLLDQ